MADRKHDSKSPGARGVDTEALQKCIVTHDRTLKKVILSITQFEGRNPQDLLEPWRRVRAGVLGPFEIAAVRREA